MPDVLLSFSSKSKTIISFLCFIAAIAAAITSIVFNLTSNISYYFNHDTDILVKTGTRWIHPEKVHIDDVIFKVVYEAESVKVSRMELRRENRLALQKMWEFFLPPKIMVFEFSPDNLFQLIAATDKNLHPISAQEAFRKGNFNFVVNTSFYLANHNLIGELIVNGKTIAHDNGVSSGFFKVVDQIPRVGPRSLFANMPGKVMYSCQAHPSVMRNGNLFHYIISENAPYHPSWKRKTYRNLIGERENGNIIFVLSNRGALLSVKEISMIAKLWGAENASLFDGGAALQYRFRHKRKRISFSAFNNSLSAGKRIEKAIHRQTGIQFVQKSPVYLGIQIIDN